MNRICDQSITCEGSDDPITNYSAEALDQIVFGAPGFPRFFPDNPLGQDGSDPALPPTWFAQSCLGFCFSAESQAAANACAQIGAYLCEQAQRYAPFGRALIPVFYNTLQQCQFRCPDGSFFVAFTPPGRVATGSQVLSDRIAYQQACEFAATHFLCLPDLTSGCVDQAYVQQITMEPGGAPYVFAITGGALPPGLSLVPVGTRLAVITGTPTTAGVFNFRLTVTDGGGNSVTKDYALSIVGISNGSTLPPATVGTAYNQTLAATGGVAPYVFTLELGTLPDGLVLNPDGTITGTPLTAGNANFVIGVADSGTAFCTKTFSIFVSSANCPNFRDLNWKDPAWYFEGNIMAGTFSAVFTPIPTGISFTLETTAPNPFNDSSAIQSNPHFALTVGSVCKCRIVLQITVSGTPLIRCAGAYVVDNLGNLYFIAQTQNLPNGIYNYDTTFTINPLASDMQVVLQEQTPCGGNDAVPQDVKIVGTLTNV